MALTDPSGQISIDARIAIRGMAWKFPCVAATTANITISTALNNGDTIDGVTLATGDHVLVKDQSSGAENGIYIVGATPVRSWDMDQDATSDVPIDEVRGAAVYVIDGSTNGGKVFFCTNTAAATLGSTSIVWEEFSSGGSATTSAPLLTAKVTRTNIGSNVTVASTTWQDIDGTNLTITGSTGANRCLLILTGRVSSSTTAITRYGFTVDGTAVETESTGSTGNGITRHDTSSEGAHIVAMTVALSAGSHTFKPRWNASAGTSTLHQSASTDFVTFQVIEIPSGIGSGEVDYVEVSSGNVNVTGTTAGTAQTLVTGTSRSFSAVPHIIQFFAPFAAPAATTGAILHFDLFEDGTHIAIIQQLRTPAGSLSHQGVVNAIKRHTPSAGTHQYVVKAHVSTGTGIVSNSTGTGGAVSPMFLRITVA